MTRVAGSGVSMRSIVVNTVLTRVPTFGSHVRARLNAASAAVNGSPLCHLTPGRILNVHSVCPWSFHSVASAAWSLPSGRRATRLSKRLNETRMSLDEVLKWGSNLEMSPPWATTSSRFCVVWAPADRGSEEGNAAAAPRAVAPLRSWRRVNRTIHGLRHRLQGQSRKRHYIRLSEAVKSAGISDRKSTRLNSS